MVNWVLVVWEPIGLVQDAEGRDRTGLVDRIIPATVLWLDLSMHPTCNCWHQRATDSCIVHAGNRVACTLWLFQDHCNNLIQSVVDRCLQHSCHVADDTIAWVLCNSVRLVAAHMAADSPHKGCQALVHGSR